MLERWKCFRRTLWILLQRHLSMSWQKGWDE